MIWQRTQACDPLNFYAWVNFAGTQLASGDFEAALDTATRGMEAAPHRQIADEVFMANLALGRVEEAWAVSLRYFEEEERLLSSRVILAAARGDASEARELADRIVQQFGAELVDVAQNAMLGDRSQANKLAAEWDARPLGFLALIDEVGTCACGAPFDLEVTPNFARLLEEANISWPPPAPINWPLKDW